MTTTLIETGVALTDVARVLKSTPAAVEADCHELSLYIGQDWAGRPALDVRDAASLVSGSARRDADHATAHSRWRAASEDWQAEREAVQRRAFIDHFDAARRRGLGDPVASSEAAVAASGAILEFERATPQPVFADTETPRLSKRVKELLSK